MRKTAFLVALGLCIMTLPRIAYAAEEKTSVFNGEWAGYGYMCFAGNSNTLKPSPKEMVNIEYTNNKIVATKLTGDPCVTAGQITWYAQIPSTIEYGKYYQAKWHGGRPSRPNSSWHDGRIIFITDSEIRLHGKSQENWSITFTNKYK